MSSPQSTATAYGCLMLAGISVSLIFWSRLAKRDDRLLSIYLGALVSAFLGAKLVYFAAEGWLHWHDENRWLQLATGKSILGALLGGYAGVELAKWLVGYRKATGDWFAIIVPGSIMIGRLGCILHGCCLGNTCEPAWFTMNDATGIARWPAAPVEFLFNGMALGGIFWLRQTGLLPGQHFHIYLIGYGLFRFLHEFMRATPHILGPFSVYQIAAVLVTALGLIGFGVRQKNSAISSFS